MTITFVVDPDVKPTSGRDQYDYAARKPGKLLPYEPFSTVSSEDMFRVKLGKMVRRKNPETHRTDFLLQSPAIEGCSERKLVGPSNGTNPLIECLNHAYDKHLPVILSPDVIWACIAQGLATHIKNNAEKVRTKFVEHEGQEHIEIFRDHFVKGSRDNDWPGCFAEFGTKIKGYIGKRYDLFAADFATTGPLEKAVSEIVLMDAMSEYFTYGMRTCCGFPRFTLTGDTADWRDLQGKVKQIREIDPDLSPWLDHLDPVVEELVKASGGNPDKRLWSSFYKLEGLGSGGPHVTGWINVLFPYLGKNKLNSYVNWANGGRRGPHPDDFPGGLRRADVTWKYFDQEFDMKFVGGLVGVSENVDDDNTLTPEFGWCVYDTTGEPVEEARSYL